MPTIDLKDLRKYVNQMAKKAMNQGNAVKNTVIEEGKKQVQETVYDVYTPRIYERSGELKESWEAEETADGMAMFNDRRDDGRYVAEVVETGQGYQYDFEYNGKPRPFTENTRKALDGSSKLTDSLRKDLKSIGIDVE
ncbi:hypothetical protein AF332_11205 [Sporosarcina globispora]|uniref:HK97 gp10 family phage protein n=1 Tax=Sporosarcina globispora TaxID=1459 RepID=A0A0M0GD35_SPOGL|nr:hypothetical protein [Sporosarcina globispora]KON87336.1 hypothetical protein AF332_11205 [Sporosarcina globispora]